MTSEAPGGALELLEELALGSARGGRKTTALVGFEVVRVLTPQDLPALLAPVPVDSQVSPIIAIRHAHHHMAQLIVEGHEMGHISLMTGFSPSWISNIQRSPAFQELLGYYQAQKELQFVDVCERMKRLGLNALDELQERLDKDPEAWSKKELMDLAEMTLQPSTQSGGKRSPNALGLAVSVRFVEAKGTTLDVVPTQVELGD